MASENARVGVTGAGGFIGLRLCRRLAADGFEVIGIDRDSERRAGIEAAGASFRHADTSLAGEVADALAGCALVVHTAAIVREWGAWEDFVRVNVQGTRNVLDAAEGAERVVHVSSVAVWGFDFGRELDEDEPPQPCGNPYVDTKGASEAIARRRGAVVLRPGDVYGPGSSQWAVRPLESLRTGQLRLPKGGGMITPVYVDDLVDALVRALTAPGARGPYTAWNGNAVSARDFFGHYARMLGKDGVPTAPMPLLRAAAAGLEAAGRLTGKPPLTTRFALDYISRTHGYSTRRSHEELGWEPQVSLEEGMGRTEEWFRSEGML